MTVSNQTQDPMNIFTRYLTLWVGLCMAVGVILGIKIPLVPAFLSQFEYAHVSIPIAI